MKYQCPSCNRKHDVSIMQVLEWIKRNEKLRKACASLIGKINRAKAKPENMNRGPDAIKPALAARRKAYEKRAKKQNPSDLGH